MLRETITVEAVDCSSSNIKLGIDGADIYIYTKDKVGKALSFTYGLSGPELFIIKVEQREMDGIFCHFKITCALRTQDANDYIPIQHLKRGTFLIVNQ